MRKITLLLMMTVLFAVVFTGCGGGSEAADGDSETASDGDDEGECLDFGVPCADNAECCGGICFSFSDGFFCSTPCTSDGECGAKQLGACCMTVQGTNLCMPVTICEGAIEDGDAEDGDSSDGDTPDGDISDGDAEVICEPNELACDPSNWVVRCNLAGTAWEPYLECTDGEVCEDNQCKLITDGDITDGDTGCGDPTITPAPILRRAEIPFSKEESVPSEAANIVETLNTAFEDKSFVKLSATEIGHELVFDLDVDFTHQYYFIMDYVCGTNWGQGSLYLNDDVTPIPLTEGVQPDRIDLHCIPGSDPQGTPQSEAIIKKKTYQPICIPEGEHKLHFRVIGKNQNSTGYTLGIDFIALLPYDEPEQP